MGIRGELGGSGGALLFSDDTGGNFEAPPLRGVPGDPNRRLDSLVWGVEGNAERRRGVPFIASWMKVQMRRGSHSCEKSLPAIRRCLGLNALNLYLWRSRGDAMKIRVRSEVN